MTGIKDRRTNPRAEGPQRRMGDRRESPRIPLKIWVRRVEAGGPFDERDGDVGVGGAYFLDCIPEVAETVELRFRLPGRDEEIQCKGEVIRLSEQDGRHGAHVRFLDMSTDAELAIARFIDDHELGKVG